MYLPSSIPAVNFHVLEFLLKFTSFGFKTVQMTSRDQLFKETRRCYTANPIARKWLSKNLTDL